MVSTKVFLFILFIIISSLLLFIFKKIAKTEKYIVTTWISAFKVISSLLETCSKLFQFSSIFRNPQHNFQYIKRHYV